jgi:hypothetical protein
MQAMVSRFILVGLLAASGLLNSAAAHAEIFPMQCSLPPASSGPVRTVDQQCGLSGAGDTDAHLAQNAAKNNFCAQGAPVDLSREDFERLQRAVEQAGIQFGERDNLPNDRSLLRQLLTLQSGTRVGEGSLVRHVGYISHPRYSNVRNGESVNCNLTGQRNNDIHFDLVQDKGDAACGSVTSEITPHHRSRMYEVDVLRLSRLSERPLRVTGQLFFDASHLPCKDGRPQENLKRISLWEIHPVYRIDVCNKTVLEDCSVVEERVWKPLEDFLNSPEEEEPVDSR